MPIDAFKVVWDEEVIDPVKVTWDKETPALPDPGTLARSTAQVAGLAEGEPETFLGRVKESWETGELQTELGILRYRQIIGEEQPEIESRIAELKARLPKQPPIKRGLPERAVRAAAEMLPIQISGMKKGAQRGLTFGMTAGAATALAGQLGPQAALPEEIITVPSAFAAGYGVGMLSGTLENIAQIEAGLAYDELVNLKDKKGNKLDPTITKSAAAGVGIINGLIELAQIKLLLKTIPGGEAFLRGAIRKATIKAVKSKALHRLAFRAAKRHGVFVTAETSQEIAQESTNILANETAKFFSNEIQKKTDIPYATRQEITKRLLQTAEQSALAFTVMGAPGQAVQITGEVIKPGAPIPVQAELAERGMPKEEITEPTIVRQQKLTRDEAIKQEFLAGLARDVADPTSGITAATVAFMGKSPIVQEMGITQEELNAVAGKVVGDAVATSVTEDIAISQNRAFDKFLDEVEEEPGLEVKPEVAPREPTEREVELGKKIEKVEPLEVEPYYEPISEMLKAEGITAERQLIEKAAKSIREITGKEPAVKKKAVEEPPVKEIEEIPTVKEIDKAAKETETEPTEAQKEAGNYKKGHLSLYGLDISIENPKGSMRTGVDPQGKEWSIELKHHYGYIKETKGKDKDHLDVFIGPKPESDKVFVVDQTVPETGKFDEHKIMMGFEIEKEARAGYLANYESGWKGLGAITELTVDDFKEWTKGDTTKAIGEIAEKPPVKEKVEEVGLPQGPYGLIEPIAKKPAKPIPEVKEPWEMGRKQYIGTKVPWINETVAGISHEKAVKQAISEGKITSHPDYPELGKVEKRERFDREIERLTKETDEAVKQNLEASKDKESIELSAKGQTTYIVHRSISQLGKWQVTYLSKVDKKPAGHFIFETRENAIKSISGERVEGPAIGNPEYRVTKTVPIPPEPKVEKAAFEAEETRAKARDAETKAWAKRLKFAASQKHLVPWIAASGGVWEVELKGEIDDIIYTEDAKGRKKPRKGLMRGFLSRKTGRTLDVVVRDAREAGFDVKNTDHLLKLIEKDLAAALIGDIKGRVGKLTTEPTTQEEFIEGLIENGREELRRKGLSDQEIERTLKEGSDTARTAPEDEVEETAEELGKWFEEQGEKVPRPTEEKPPTEIEQLQAKITALEKEAFDVAKKIAKPWTEKFKARYQLELKRHKKQIAAYEEQIVTFGQDIFRPPPTTGTLFPPEVEIPPRPLVNPKASYIQQDKQKLKQQAWDKKYGQIEETRLAIAGEKAIGAPTGALAKAQEMLAKGENEEDVRKETGWMKGAEGKWKWEIDDSRAKITTKIEDLAIDSFGFEDGIKLIDFLVHPALFKAYPQLKTIPIKMELGEINLLAKGLKPGASYLPEKRTIEIRAKNLRQAKDEVIHEIQHAIQVIEGFARGGMPGQFVSKYKQRMWDLMEGVNQYNIALKDSVGNPKVYDRLMGEKLALVKEYQELEELGPLEAVQKYKHLAGEIEAREVAMRKDLTPELRQLLPPYYGEAIPREEWIIREGEGKNFSLHKEDKYQYLINCVGCDNVETLDKMIDEAKEVSYDTFISHVDIEELSNIVDGYDWGPGKKEGLRLKDDWAVSYYKSEYEGKPVYYMEHSAIEYIFAQPWTIKEGEGTSFSVEPALAAEPEGYKFTKRQQKDLINIGQLVPQWLKRAGADEEVLKNITIELKPFINLRGKNVDKTLRDWEKEGVDAGKILGATTLSKHHALIQLATNRQRLAELERSTYHEWYHVAKAWMLPQSDIRALRKHFKTEESEADAFAQYMKNAKSIQGKPDLIKRLFLKLKRMLTIIRNGLKGMGFSRPEDVFGSIRVRAYKPVRGAKAVTAVGIEPETKLAMEKKPPTISKEEKLAQEYVEKALGKVKETKVVELKPTEEITGPAYDKIVEQEAQKPIDQLIEEALNDERLVHHVRSTLKKAMSIGKKEGIAKQKGHDRAVVARAKARKEQIAKIRKMVDALKEIDTEKMSPQEAEPVNALLAGLNLVKPTKKTIIRLTRTREYLEKDHDAELPEYVMESLKRLDKRNIRDMNLEEIAAIHTGVMHYVHLNKVKNIIKVRREARRKAEVLASSIGEMKAPKQIKSDIVSSQKSKIGRTKKTAKLLKDTFGIRHDHYDLIIETLAGQNSTMDKVLYQDIKDGITEQLKYKQDTYAQFLKDVGPDFSEKYGIKDISNWLNEKVTVGRFEFTRTERMAFLRHTLNIDNLRHLLAGGFGFRISETPNVVHKITAKDLSQILQSLTPAEKHFAGTAVNNLFEEQYKRLNKVFYQKNGYPLPKTKDPYYPIEVMPITLGTDLETVDALEKFKGVWTRIGLEKGMLEKRVKSRKPVYLNSIVFDINRSVMKSAAYIGLELPLSNASKLLYDQAFRVQLEDRYGKQTWREIEKGLRDIAGDYQSYTTVEEMALKLKNNLSVAMLGINPFVMTKQVLSLPVYLPYVKLEYMLQGMVDFAVHPIEVSERHKMYSPEYLERVEGGYSRDVADVFKGAAMKRLYAGRTTIKEKFMGGIQLFDRTAVSAGMQGAVLQVLDEFDQGKLSREVRIALDMQDADIAKLTPAEKMKQAYKFADYATERTQPMFSPEHRSSLSRGATIEKLATMFGAFTNQALNLMRRTYREARRTGEPAAYAKLAKVLFLILVVNTLGVMSIDEIRNRLYKKKDRPSIAGRILNTWAGYMFFVRDVANSVISKVEKGTFLGYDVELPVQRVPELLSNTLANAVNMVSEKTHSKRKKAATRFVDDSLNLILTMQGIPYQTPKKMILGAVKPKESKAVHY